MDIFMEVGWMREGGNNYPLLHISGNIHHEAIKLGTDILPTM